MIQFADMLFEIERGNSTSMTQHEGLDETYDHAPEMY
jgi:hypothetical protein